MFLTPSSPCKLNPLETEIHNKVVLSIQLRYTHTCFIELHICQFLLARFRFTLTCLLICTFTLLQNFALFSVIIVFLHTAYIITLSATKNRTKLINYVREVSVNSQTILFSHGTSLPPCKESGLVVKVEVYNKCLSKQCPTIFNFPLMFIVNSFRTAYIVH